MGTTGRGIPLSVCGRFGQPDATGRDRSHRFVPDEANDENSAIKATTARSLKKRRVHHGMRYQLADDSSQLGFVDAESTPIFEALATLGDLPVVGQDGHGRCHCASTRHENV